ncbi:D,D-heptose 1,7-bisphosphate phosphatase [Noviherbaspirillum humi]|uniref:D,D-heptose 1,7-bisphosphate phosphatase n=1 Tax=Noviherbaspirillum humi TaxID=1688639 RepID=A0A239IZT4_9BURK|nr:HAD family hydrolase [Noviherbaspirillum humi]SNS99127.1 D,D-heptose 1,7-bisphosphate phosphatase [Noviherbaspirillum humi]
MRAIFLDKDGTLIPDVPYNVDPDLITLSDKAAEGLRLMRELGYRLIVITNQSGIARGMFEPAALQGVQARIAALLADHGVTIDGFYYCPHHPQGKVAPYARDCDCRKPMPGMLLQAAREHGIDMAQSWMIGDILNDVEAGKRAGCRSILIDNGNETEWVPGGLRTPDSVVANLLEAAQAIARATQSDTEDMRQ